MATTGENIRDLLNRDPFVAFRLVTTSGTQYDVYDANAAALLKSEVFLVLPDGDHWVMVPLIHIASIESIPNGRGRGRRRRKS